MAFTEKQEYKIEVLDNGVLQIRRADVVLKDGTEVGRKYHRHTLTPGSDTSNEVKRVKDIAEATWTPTVKAAYKASQITVPAPEVSTGDIAEPEVGTADL